MGCQARVRRISTSTVPWSISDGARGMGLSQSHGEWNRMRRAAIAQASIVALQTLTFHSCWSDMDNVWWLQSTGSATATQFTNVSAVLLPEPGTYVLTLTGLVGLALARLRRRNAV